MKIETWQLVFIIMVGLSLGIAMGEHGKPKTGVHNFLTSLIAILIEVFILFMGGFFTK